VQASKRNLGHVFPHLQNALHAEALAAESALQIAQQHGMGKVCLETDAMLLKSAVEDKSLDLSSRIKSFVW
jgi:hypothetical protein